MSLDHSVIANAIELFERTAATAASSSQLDEFLAFLPGTPRYTSVRVHLIFHDGDLLSYLSQMADRLAELSALNLEAGAFGLRRTYGRTRVRTAEGTFAILPCSVQSIHRLVTISRSTFWNVAVRRFIRNRYPRVIPVFFRQVELREALGTLQRELGPAYRLMVEEVSMKERRSGPRAHPVPATYDSDRKWTDRPVTALFDEALERQQWFTSIAFRVEYRSAARRAYFPVASCRLYKHGHIHFSALYRQFSDSLLPVLERVAYERVVLFAHRGIRERHYESANPLEIVYSRDIFGERDALERFTDTLRRYPHATKALLHSNPYLHASVADFEDGSSIEVWILSPRRILLVPQAKASIAALGRLTSYIFSEFEEGSVGEYSG